jgi:hypothetical protein
MKTSLNGQNQQGRDIDGYLGLCIASRRSRQELGSLRVVVMVKEL